MRELRAIGDRMRETFEGAGYGEIHTPALEYEEVLRLGDASAAGARYRTFDEQGDVLALRSDMTIPIARVVATRYEDAEPPFRFSYSSRAWRATDRGVGEPREFLQAGIELIGIPGRGGRGRGDGAHDRGARRRRAAPAPHRGRRRLALPATAARARRAAGGAPAAARGALAARPRGPRDWAWPSWAWGSPSASCSSGCPSCAAGATCSSAPTARWPSAVESLRVLYGELERRGVADRVIFDLGLVRELGYYTGAVFEVYDPAVGFALGGGGRYDDLIGRFGRDLPACGVGLDVQRVHLAQAAEEALA